MRRSYIVGVAALLVVVAAGATAMVNHSTPHQATVATTASGTGTPSPAGTAAVATTSAGTIDSVTNSILQNANTAAADVVNESNDGTLINNDLQNYANVNNNSYDSTI